MRPEGGVFARSPGAWASRQPRATRGVMMRATMANTLSTMVNTLSTMANTLSTMVNTLSGFREAGALKQHVTVSFLARGGGGRPG